MTTLPTRSHCPAIGRELPADENAQPPLHLRGSEAGCGTILLADELRA